METKKLELEILTEAKKYVTDGTISFLPFDGYIKYATEGNRLHFENAYFERRRQLAALGLAYWLDRDLEVKSLLEQLLWEICNEYSWALPAHLPMIQEDYGVESPEWLDLFAAETGQALSELVELLGQDFSPLINQRIYTEVNRRVFEPLEKRNWEWELKENNWSSVIGGAIGMSALSLLPKNSKRQTKLIKRLDIAMQSYLRSFGDDGACVEGVGYWAYGFGYYIYYAKKLSEVTGDTSYLDLPKVKKIATFPYYTMINKDSHIPFSDYSKVELPSGLVSFCHSYFKVPISPMKSINAFDSDHCYRFAHIYRNLIWNQSSIYSQEIKPINHWFPDVQWWISRDNRGTFFAARGGHNAESHNHLDVGHFIFGTTEQLFFTDLGAGEYTKNYFNDEYRYEFFPNGALSHSVPQINGMWQQDGFVGSNVVLQTAEKLTLNLSRIYSGAGLEKYTRHFSLSGKTLVIKDSFIFEDNQNTVIENFVTQIPPKVCEDTIYLKAGNTVCELQLGTTAIEIGEHIFSNHHGEEEVAYTIQAHFELGIKEQREFFISIIEN